MSKQNTQEKIIKYTDFIKKYVLSTPDSYKISLDIAMELPSIFRRTPKCMYRCVCGDTFDTIEDACFHIDGEGFCENGMREYNNLYECRCGVKNMIRTKAEFNHYYENKGRCIDKKELKLLTRCDTCKKDFHHISWYERHCETKYHKDRLIQTLTLLDLQCKICNVKCTSQNQIKAHIQTKKHKKLSETGENPLDLECNICNIKCRGQKEIKKHLETKKHRKMELTNTSQYLHQ